MIARLAATVVVGLLLSACGSDAQAQPDPCKTFTDEQAAGATGNSVTHAKATGTGKGCYWLPIEQPGTSLLVTLETDDTVEKFAEAKANVGKSGADVRDMAIGDEAFAFVSKQTSGAERRTGEQRVRVLLQGDPVTGDAVSLLREATITVP